MHHGQRSHHPFTGQTLARIPAALQPHRHQQPLYRLVPRLRPPTTRSRATFTGCALRPCNPRVLLASKAGARALITRRRSAGATSRAQSPFALLTPSAKAWLEESLESLGHSLSGLGSRLILRGGAGHHHSSSKPSEKQAEFRPSEVTGARRRCRQRDLGRDMRCCSRARDDCRREWGQESVLPPRLHS